MYKTVLFKGQWQKTLLGIVSVFGDSHFSLFFFSTSRFSSVRLLLNPISHHIYKVHIHLPFLSPTYSQSKKKKKKVSHKSISKKGQNTWSFCNKVQERLHIAHYLYSHWSWWPWSHSIINLDQRDRQRKLAVGVTFYLFSQ